jgi:hypothetical protein
MVTSTFRDIVASLGSENVNRNFGGRLARYLAHDVTPSPTERRPETPYFWALVFGH